MYYSIDDDMILMPVDLSLLTSCVGVVVVRFSGQVEFVLTSILLMGCV